MAFFKKLFNKQSSDKEIPKQEKLSKMSPAERYLQHLDTVFGQEAVFFKEESLLPGLPGVTGIVYRNIPEKDFVTVVTYGLSLVKHPSWKSGRPELIMTVNSKEQAWENVTAYVANKLRGQCPFTYGETINFNEQISPDSKMNAFFIFAPSILAREDFLNIDIGTDYKISIAGLYPMYANEISVLGKIGIKEFWHHPNFDLYDVNRKEITAD